MFNIRRFYNQNRKKIWGILMIIAFFIIILQLLNGFVATNTETQEQQGNNQTISKSESDISNISSDKSSVTGETIPSIQLETETKVIEKFIKFCNEGKLQEAYSMLTDECKEQLFSKIEDFEEVYYSKILKNQDINCNIENWIGSIYKVKITGDILSAGEYNLRKSYSRLYYSKKSK